MKPLWKQTALKEVDVHGNQTEVVRGSGTFIYIGNGTFAYGFSENKLNMLTTLNVKNDKYREAWRDLSFIMFHQE